MLLAGEKEKEHSGIQLGMCLLFNKAGPQGELYLTRVYNAGILSEPRCLGGKGDTQQQPTSAIPSHQSGEMGRHLRGGCGVHSPEAQAH